EAGAAEVAADDAMIFRQQHAAVPQPRLAGAALDEMRVDLGAPLGGERPRPGCDGECQAIDGNDGQGHRRSGGEAGPPGQASITPSVATTDSPPTAADASLPARVAQQSPSA